MPSNVPLTEALSFVPVADFREVRREILRYGASVEVVSPSELRKEIKHEIQKMPKTYA